MAWRSNPKRDGSPTRGELRKKKYLDHLRSLKERGDRAHKEVLKAIGRKVGQEDGTFTEPALKAPVTATQLEHPGHFADSPSASQQSAMDNLMAVEEEMADIRQQMEGLEDDDEALAESLSEKLTKLGAKRKSLQAQAKEPAATNPGTRSGSASWGTLALVVGGLVGVALLLRNRQA
jgi:hypothetical protein